MQNGTVVVAAAGNEADDLAHPTMDVTSPDNTTPVTREITNACAVIPVEIPGVIGVTADGKQVMNIMVPAGQQRVIHARDKVVVKTGNAAGIELAYNGVAIPAIGLSGEVKTVTFNSKGLVR